MTIALARKYRPRVLKEIIGQEKIVKSITDSITQKKLHHAYIFFGTRGVGKTSIARIIAKSVNCRLGITEDPCQNCIPCKEVDEGCFIDLIEVDAASNTKVDEFRGLLEDVSKSPGKGKYKIYIIDEVHMLSKYSFNALLKTLEEPPQHCIFILATTSIKQVPATILSRCLRFSLKTIDNKTITARLVEILKKERINFDAEGIKTITVAARGSMRDALSLLEQASTYGNKTIKGKDVRKMLGTIDKKIITYLLKALYLGKREHILKIIRTLSIGEVDFSLVISDLISTLHKIAIIQSIPESITTDTNNDLLFLARKVPEGNIHIYYQIAVAGKYDLMYSSSPVSGFEILILRMLTLAPSKKERKSDRSSKETVTKNIVFCSNLSLDYTRTWYDFVNTADLSGASLILAQNCHFTSMKGENIKLLVSEEYIHLLQLRNKKDIENAAKAYYKKEISLEMSTIKGEDVNSISFVNECEKDRIKNVFKRFDAKPI